MGLATVAWKEVSENLEGLEQCGDHTTVQGRQDASLDYCWPWCRRMPEHLHPGSGN